MHLEVIRFFVISLPQAIFPLIATLVLFQEDVVKLWKKVVCASFLFALVTLFSFNFVKINSLKMAIDIIFVIIIFKILFKITWFRTLLLAFVYYVITFLSTAGGFLIAVYCYKSPLSETVMDLSNLLKAFFPSFLITIPIAYAVRPLGNSIYSIFVKVNLLKTSTFYYLLLAILLQFFLSLGIFSHIFEEIGFYEPSYTTPLFTLALFGLIIYFFFKFISLTEKRVMAQSQEAISENITGLINSVRSQRHDFLNSIQIINSLVHSKDKEGLKQYLSQVTKSVSFYNTLAAINEPVISAMLNSIITRAETKGIQVKIHNSADLSILSTMAFDIARILGILLNDVMDKLSDYEEDKRWIQLIIEDKHLHLHISINSPGGLPESMEDENSKSFLYTCSDNYFRNKIQELQLIAKKVGGRIEYNDADNLKLTISLILKKP